MRVCQADGCEKVLHGHQRRRWCSEKCRKLQYQTPCAECGQPAWGERCSDCDRTLEIRIADQRRKQVDRWAKILDLRRQGYLNTEISTELRMGNAMNVAKEVWRMRQAGIPVPESTYDRSSWGAWNRIARFAA